MQKSNQHQSNFRKPLRKGELREALQTINPQWYFKSFWLFIYEGLFLSCMATGVKVLSGTETGQQYSFHIVEDLEASLPY